MTVRASSELMPATVRRSTTYRVRGWLTTTLTYAVLIFVAAISSLPMFWMISTSLKAYGREFIHPPEWIPVPIVWSNYIEVWGESSIHLYTINSFMVAGLATLGTLLSCSLVAFGFARLQFFGRNLLFGILVATLMLPSIVVLVPTFILFRQLEWINTPMPLIVPWWFGGGAFGGAFYVFLMRQFMLQLPPRAGRGRSGRRRFIPAHLLADHPAAGKAGAGGYGDILVHPPLERFPPSTHIPALRDVANAGAGAAVLHVRRIPNRGRRAVEPDDGGGRGHADACADSVFLRAALLHSWNCAQWLDRTVADSAAAAH